MNDPKLKPEGTPDPDTAEVSTTTPMTYTAIPEYVPYPYDSDIIGGYDESGE